MWRYFIGGGARSFAVNGSPKIRLFRGIEVFYFLDVGKFYFSVSYYTHFTNYLLVQMWGEGVSSASYLNFRSGRWGIPVEIIIYFTGVTCPLFCNGILGLSELWLSRTGVNVSSVFFFRGNQGKWCLDVLTL